MNFSLKLTMIIAAIFAAICFSVAVTGFTSIGEITDPKLVADAWGFSWFWAFLGGVALLFGALSWWMSRSQGGRDQE